MVESRIPLQLTEKPMKLLAVIPARGNSTRVPGKNKMKFGGVPCVVKAIQAVQESSYQITIAVVSNDPEIRALAAKNGALALRESEIVAKGDLYDVLYFALQKVDGPWEAILLAYPNVPIRPAGLFDRLIDTYLSGDLLSVNARCQERSASGGSVFSPDYLNRVFVDRGNRDFQRATFLDYNQDELLEIDTTEDVHWANTLFSAGAVQ